VGVDTFAKRGERIGCAFNVGVAPPVHRPRYPRGAGSAVFRSTSAFALNDPTVIKSMVTHMSRQMGMPGHQAEKFQLTLVQTG